MKQLHYIGLDVHKKSITYTIKTQDGALIDQASLPAQRAAVRHWAAGLEQPFAAALEATMFSGWVCIYPLDFSYHGCPRFFLHTAP